jgi:D-glycero-alpha-D-manno-heptose-7-phosphate kinase
VIITRTPFRISFLGGGSDYPEWYSNHVGICVGAAIKKYCYITYQPNQEQFRVLYSKLEECARVDQISHPAVRACLDYMQVSSPVSILHTSDLHARSGIGSSSAFVVGLLNAIYTSQGRQPHDISKDAITIEQDILKEPVGSQDQILTALGGINEVIFHPTSPHATVRNLDTEMWNARIKEFHSHLMLLYVGPRTITIPTPLTFPIDITRRLATMAKEGAQILTSYNDISQFGALLHEGWTLKKQMSDSISNSLIDEVYSIAKANGAIGGKLLGAGGGGFMLLFAKPEDHAQLRHVLPGFTHVPFEFDFEGSKVIYNVG